MAVTGSARYSLVAAEVMDVLQQLRDATRAHHQSIEAQVDLLRPDLSVGEYRNLLGRFYGFYGPLEAALVRAADWRHWDFPIEERCKTGYLQQDLVHLGFSLDALGSLPRCPDLPLLGSPAEALGCLYVLEGATLGGQLILKHVMPLLDLMPDAGCAFFNSYGANVGRNWRCARNLLQRVLQTDAAAAQAARSACDTFARLEHWLAGRHGQYGA